MCFGNCLVGDFIVYSGGITEADDNSIAGMQAINLKTKKLYKLECKRNF